MLRACRYSKLFPIYKSSQLLKAIPHSKHDNSISYYPYAILNPNNFFSILNLILQIVKLISYYPNDNFIPLNSMHCFTLLNPFKSSPYYAIAKAEIYALLSPWQNFTLLPTCNSVPFYPDSNLCSFTCLRTISSTRFIRKVKQYPIISMQ